MKISSSSSSHEASTDIPYPLLLSLSLPIRPYHPSQVFQTTSCIRTDVLFGKFLPVSPEYLIYMKGSIRERHL